MSIYAQAMESNTLRSICAGVIIVAHKENTSLLRDAMTDQGLSVIEVRGPYSPEQERWSSAMKCFANHANAWRIVAAQEQPYIVVEADFVPVKGFGNLPVPCPPEKLGDCLPYLYACGPQFWDLAGSVARGHAGGLVALVIWPKVARLMLEYFAEQTLANPLGHYVPFDAGIGYWLKDRGIETYIPRRHYGEHGGVANPEHAAAGLGRPHQADSLQATLAFLPLYAKGNRIRFWKIRLRARGWGWLRLVTGRIVAWHDFARSNRTRMARFVFGRLWR